MSIVTSDNTADTTAAAIAAGCACNPAWPALAVTRDDGSTEPVHAADTPGPLALLYYAHYTRCGVQYPGPFRLPPRTPARAYVRGRTGPAPTWVRHHTSADRTAAGDSGTAR
ncbi:hypothetical protein [Amycolatopsis sp. FDAARGOS 1241]|uniref:hypothetical protein n=1 Tax=Amycolatopsis sp. FDAARGOS 1241 TaxID=2778070 RepID=UPI001951F222|nr:hypothetical protein [Amycolatopsis sp. FDAARGOS 1241]QRP42998.1 hypothetical protein I6J71_26510 [Amycolatopsis sp. FDAARGOS 1241]